MLCICNSLNGLRYAILYRFYQFCTYLKKFAFKTELKSLKFFSSIFSFNYFRFSPLSHVFSKQNLIRLICFKKSLNIRKL